MNLDTSIFPNPKTELNCCATIECFEAAALWRASLLVVVVPAKRKLWMSSGNFL